MSKIGLTNSQVSINNIAIPIVPNSLKIDLGLGEQNVKATGGGGGNSETVYFEDASTNIGCVKFEMYSTKLTLEFHQDWKALTNANFIQVIDKSGVSTSFPFMAHTNRVEIEIGSDKTVPIEFEGGVAISGDF